MTITIAPKTADIIETMIKINANPHSPVASAMKKEKEEEININ